MPPDRITLFQRRTGPPAGPPSPRAAIRRPAGVCGAGGRARLLAVVVLATATVTAGAAARAGPAGEAAEVRTSRSDGALFAATAQQPRRERARRVRIVSSVQALPAPGQWSRTLDPADGGVTVAPAGRPVASGSATPVVLVGPGPDRVRSRPVRPDREPGRRPVRPMPAD